MKKYDNITLLIHGPITIYTIFTLYRYAEYFDIVVCAPKYHKSINDSIWRELEEISNSKKYNVSLFVYGGVNKSTYNNEQNRFFHFFSVVLGLQACKTDFVIKMRSDEFYSNLEPFIDTMIEDTSKMTTNDVFFRNSAMPFHPSDHLMGGKVSLMRSTFELAKQFCEQPEMLGKNVFMRIVDSKLKDSKFIPAEHYVGTALLTHLYPPDTLQSEIDIVKCMKESFTIVDSDELGVVRIAANSIEAGKEFFDTSYRNKDTDVFNIEDYK